MLDDPKVKEQIRQLKLELIRDDAEISGMMSHMPLGFKLDP